MMAIAVHHVQRATRVAGPARHIVVARAGHAKIAGAASGVCAGAISRVTLAYVVPFGLQHHPLALTFAEHAGPTALHAVATIH